MTANLLAGGSHRGAAWRTRSRSPRLTTTRGFHRGGQFGHFQHCGSFPDCGLLPSQLDTLLTLTGDAGSDQITVIMETATFSVSGWGFVDLVCRSLLSIIGTNGADTITGGGPASNSITGGLGADMLFGGGAGDRFNYSAGNQIAAGESVDGGPTSTCSMLRKPAATTSPSSESPASNGSMYFFPVRPAR